MAAPQEKLTVAANLWLRQMYFKDIGDANEGHTHNYNHCTLLAHGSVRVHVEGRTKDFVAPQVIFIQAGKSHHIEALEPGTVAYCVHALRDKDTTDIIGEDQIPAGIDVNLDLYKLVEPL